MHAINRRAFMKTSTGVMLAAGIAGAKEDADNEEPATRAIALGGPTFVSDDDLDALAKAHRDIGYRAAYCPHASAGDTDRLKAIRDAFAGQGVVLAEAGRWCNLLDADPDKRKANLEGVIDGLAVAEATGARCCVNIAGSFSKEAWYGPHPDNFSQRFFDAAVENARRIIDAVKPKRAKFAYEMMGWALPNSPDAYLQMLKAVDREAFGVHLDLCNLVNCPERFYDNTALINECFDKLGPHIVSCHAKDLVWDVEMNIHFREVPAGTGRMDWTTHLRRLARMKNPPPLMIEHCADEKQYTLARESLFKTGKNAGVRFG